MTRVIITGATGFVGANLLRRLLAEGHEVHLLLRRGYNPWRIEGVTPAPTLHEVDLGDRAALERFVGSVRPAWVFHLAAYGAYPTQTDLAQMLATNVSGTVNLVEACLSAGVEVLVNTGSSSEYGFKDHAPTEREWLDPNSHYAVTKAFATQYCRYTAQSRQVRMPTLRLYSVFGPYEEPTRLLPALIVRGLRGELPPLVRPDIARDYVYADDVNDAYLLAATRPLDDPGAVYNLGSGVQTSLREAVDVARRVLSITAEPRWGSMPDRHWDTTVWRAEIRAIERELGWRPRHTLEQGFRRMVDWFRRYPALLEWYAERMGLAG